MNRLNQLVFSDAFSARELQASNETTQFFRGKPNPFAAAAQAIREEKPD
jgi:hypothetical protein